MSELNLSLYKLAEGGDLLELFEIRAELEANLRAVEASDPDVAEVGHENLRVVEEQIALYMAALPAKVDGVRAVWRRIESLIAEGQEEVRFQSKRVQTLKADLDRLKDYCQRCMELIKWKPNKPRKLQGRSGYLLLKANGGRPAVEVTDESLVPEELCTVTVTMPADMWGHLKANGATVLALNGQQSMAVAFLALNSPRVPSLSLIAEALSQPCCHCNGTGTRDLHGTVMAHGAEPEDLVKTCPDCSGSGKRSVAGARLKLQGAHVECK